MRSRRLHWLAGLLCAAWLVPLVLHQLRLDVVQLVILLVAVASILRSGTNIVDRLMLAGSLLAGALLALGLLFSIWPWGLQPIPAGGTCFTLVAVAGWLTRRRPSLPRRWLGSDVVVVGSGLFAFWAAYAPVASLPAVKRFTYSATAEDRYAHFALFDTIHRLGGYTFLHPIQAVASVQAPTEIVYPMGSHFLYALFDTFLRSTTAPGAPLPEFNRYFIYVLAAYAFLTMALVWAARWIAGPLVTHWRRIFVCSVVAGFAIGGPFVVMVEAGFDSQVAGLAFLAVAVAVMVRPPCVVREHVLIACALVIAVAYAYNLYAPIAVLGLLASCLVYRRRLRRYWRFTVVTILAGCTIALYPSALSLASGFNAQAQALSPGVGVPVPVPLIIVLALAVVATMGSGVSRRLPASAAMTAHVVIAVVVIAAFGIYQVVSRGQTSYYYDKLLNAGSVVCVVGLGAVGIVLRRLPAPSRPGGWLLPLREVQVAVVSAAVGLSLAALLQWGPHPSGGSPLFWGRTALSKWNAGQVTALTGQSMITLADAHLLADGVPTLVFYSDWGLENWRDSFLAAAFNRDLGPMKDPINAILSARIGGPPLNAYTTRRGLRAVLTALRESPFPLRLIVADPLFAQKLRGMLAAHPDVHATVVVLRSLRR
ncbi:MAG TPA: hypothetical protein VLW50_02220 [Streptosporangiaceae bacterium]|nr:hypothetical protein [Streptosporangiaceae bacterium]